jgi:lipid-A-disaccharide synthase-like uncharacterized protein
MLDQLLDWLSSHFNFLVLFGLIGQILFMMRFVAQWIFSEKAKRSVVPEVFWYFSLGGGIILLIYAVLRNDLVFILGQATGLFIYTRNVIFIWRDRAKRRQQTHEQVFEDLNRMAADLATRYKTGVSVSHEERRAAAEALHILQGAAKSSK